MRTCKKPEKKFTIADILGLYWRDYTVSPGRLLKLEDKHFKAVSSILTCQTASMGVNVFMCEECGKKHYVFKSCKHRFCPRCGIVETYSWAERTLSGLLRMKHHHVVFTLPKALRWLARRNGDVLHNLLFKASASVIKDWFEYRHGLRCGIVSVLHTAGSDLKYHPHVHMIVTGGGLDENGDLQELEKAYLTRQRFFGDKFRDAYRELLLKTYRKGELEVARSMDSELLFKRWLNKLGEKQWIVSIQDPLEQVEHIVRYVGRYTKRACMSEYKLESIDDGKIRFRFNDYANTPRGEKPRIGTRTMKSDAFLDALLQHVPNKGYRMVRYYGIYGANSRKHLPDEVCGIEVGQQEEATPGLNEYSMYYEYRRKTLKSTGKDPLYCYDCDRPLLLLAMVNSEEALQLYEYEDSS